MTKLKPATNVPAEERLGKILAYLLSAPVMALVLTIIVASTYLDKTKANLCWTLLTLCFLTFFPLAAYLIPQFLKATKGKRKIQRMISFIVSLASFAVGALILWLGKAPRVLIIVTLCYVATAYSLAFVNLFYKASGHTSGVTGPAVIYLFLYGVKALPVLVLIPLIMWARVKEKEHSLGQTIAGAIISSCASFLVIRCL